MTSPSRPADVGPILREGYWRKGGSNTAISQVRTRPAAPAASVSQTPAATISEPERPEVAAAKPGIAPLARKITLSPQAVK